MTNVIPPRKVGTEVTFVTNGKTFRLKRLAGNVFCLTCPLDTGRARFADTAKEIMVDVAACFESGTLPGKPGSC